MANPSHYSPSPYFEEQERLRDQYGRLLERADDLDLATRALLLAGITLSLVEVGIVAFSSSRLKKAAGAMAPIVAFGLAAEADKRFLNATDGMAQTVTHAINVANAASVPVPEWVGAAELDLSVRA